MDKLTNDPYVLIAIVHVSDFRLQCTPSGSYQDPQYGTLDKAKYQFIGERLHGANDFDEDFMRMYSLLSNIQNAGAKTQYCKDMLNENTIRFAKNVFEKREFPVPDSPTSTKCAVYLEDLENPQEGSSTVTLMSKMDAETAHWPIKEEYVNDLEGIKANYKAIPLCVYDSNDMFVEPANVNKMLHNTLVEVHFTLHHTYIPKSTLPHDSFRANIKQILILDSGKQRENIYRTDPCTGPIWMHHSPPPADLPPTKKMHTEESRDEQNGKEKE
ncbi:uncharacterized protein EDB91DRAFT_1081049 [Suillus paluster]|uniref:uncharacterized protein n=1 Tax=Suillus paluster TaxID=48578 RepID=UPI001B861356|nr:uncharacterized protein EDB91DRAFT_1081049 [Suillus paluster]KAG1743669.1 hypothetical protein EDB91DRAFT_1081049 [Suillus paluster]